MLTVREKYRIGDKYKYIGEQYVDSLLNFGFHPGSLDEDDYCQDHRVTIVGYNNDNIWYRPNVSSYPIIVDTEIIKKSIDVFFNNFKKPEPPYIIELDQWYRHIESNTWIYVVGFNVKYNKIWYRVPHGTNEEVHHLILRAVDFIEYYVIEK